MKKSTFRKIISALLAAVMLFCSASLLSCDNGGTPSDTSANTPSDTTTASGSSDTTANTPSDTTTPADVDDSVKLSALTLSDGTNISFSPDKTEYEITLPAGNPRLPIISATAKDAGALLEVYQATRAPGATETVAKVTVTNGGKTGTYTVKMKISKDKGFVLQYDDRYTFKPAYTLASGESFEFRSSDAKVLSVTSGGVVTALATSASAVTIEALVGGVVKDTLTVDRVEKAALALFLIVGQSNAWGSHDDGDSSGAAQSDKPAEGIAYYINANDGGIGSIVDLSKGRSGFGPSLAKHWYELTGEKSLLVHTAISGSPIETWLKGGDKYSSKGNGYDNTLAAYKFVTKQSKPIKNNFEIIRTGCFWCQGETGQVREWTGSGWSTSNPKIQQSDDYYNKFMKMYADFKADMNIDFFSIMLVRALKQTVSAESLSLGLLTDLVPVRAAQYTINNTTDDSLIIASRLCDIARMASDKDKKSEGYAYMGPENVHRTQIGYNAEGIELAENTYKLISATSDRTPTSLEVLAPDGRTRLADGDVYKAPQGKPVQLAAIVLPLYCNAPGLSFSVASGADKCSVDKFGKVTFTASAAVGTIVEIKISADCGFTKTVKIELVKGSGSGDTPTVSGKELTLVWNFDDLTEENGYSDLKLSSRSGSGKYSISGGTIKLNDRNTDFALSTPFALGPDFDWSIEWRAKASNSSALFGNDYSKNNFIYVAFCTANWSYPFRMVDASGNTAMIPYGKYVDKNREMNVWRVEYKASTKTMTLYFLGADGKSSEVVGTYNWGSTNFVFNITNMFGRYASGSTLVCWNGEVDYVKVMARAVN